MMINQYLQTIYWATKWLTILSSISCAIIIRHLGSIIIKILYFPTSRLLSFSLLYILYMCSDLYFSKISTFFAYKSHVLLSAKFVAFAPHHILFSQNVDYRFLDAWRRTTTSRGSGHYLCCCRQCSSSQNRSHRHSHS